MLRFVKRIFACIIITVSTLLPAISQSGQDTLLNISQDKPQFIPVANIASELTDINEVIRKYRDEIITPFEESKLKGLTDTLLLKVSMMRDDPRISQIESLSFSNLSKLENEWNHIKIRVEEQESLLMELFNAQQGVLTGLNNKKIIWNLTLDNINSRNSPTTLITRVNSMIDTLNRFESRFISDLDFLQEQLVNISTAVIICNNALAEIREAEIITANKLFRITHPPIWKTLNSLRSGENVLTTRRSLLSDIYNEFRDFGHENSFRIFLHLLLFILLIRVITKSFKSVRADIDNLPDAGTKTVKLVVHKPWSTAILVTFLLSYPIYGLLPGTVGFLNLIIIFFPVVMILYHILPLKTRRLIILPSVSVLLAFLHSYTFGASVISRIFLSGLDLFAIVSVISAISKRTFRDHAPSKRAGMIFYYLAILGTILMFVSLIASVIGAVRLAEFITYATLNSLALVFVIYAISKTLNSLIYVLIYRHFSESFKAIGVYRDLIYRRISSAVVIISWTVWTFLALRQFAVRNEVVSFIRKVFSAGASIGSARITIADILLFIVIIWFTVWVSRIIKIIIEGEIAPRVRMKRGVPGAITLLLRISIITIGFLIAFAVTGVELSKMAILLGALGVGIGFGLQNIFNNLVSGIILAFERPIQEGDVIEVGELWGTVKEIGIRSSIIFTFDGAEVIVPNGNLISRELINWTLTDKQRRAELTIGVAYGTDPEKVLEILHRVAEDEENVMKEPAPLALFTGFGSSSLDFRLLIWITSADQRFLIQSRLYVAINRALADAGIEIPFPQHDLHIRSVEKSTGEQYLKE